MASTEGRQRRRVLFSGHVQGVGFRYRACRTAERFDVAGFVRNLSDGRVELVAEGEAPELDRFIHALQDEMENHIREVQSNSSSATGEFHGFEIRG